mmetsp:Transcript_24563/g.70068  ORF Transcript_24563/g.70068 Transcript_24563/m.70068 type:complete len:259 (+) Transcript_24563:145-921(+)
MQTENDLALPSIAPNEEHVPLPRWHVAAHAQEVGALLASRPEERRGGRGRCDQREGDGEADGKNEAFRRPSGGREGPEPWHPEWSGRCQEAERSSVSFSPMADTSADACAARPSSSGSPLAEAPEERAAPSALPPSVSASPGCVPPHHRSVVRMAHAEDGPAAASSAAGLAHLPMEAGGDDGAHASSTCRPCVFEHLFGCKKRTDCAFCHLPHTRSQIEGVALRRSTVKCFERRARGEGHAAAGEREESPEDLDVIHL